jgi:hypothetical protein
MQLEKLLRDATNAPPSASNRSLHLELVQALNKAHPSEMIGLKGVEKWFARKSMPAKWLLRIAALPTPPLNPADYK